MTLEEREQRYRDGLRDLERRCGLRLEAVVQHETLGPVLQIRPGLRVVPIPDWSPPNDDDM